MKARMIDPDTQTDLVTECNKAIPFINIFLAQEIQNGRVIEERLVSGTRGQCELRASELSQRHIGKWINIKDVYLHQDLSQYEGYSKVKHLIN